MSICDHLICEMEPLQSTHSPTTHSRKPSPSQTHLQEAQYSATSVWLVSHLAGSADANKIHNKTLLGLQKCQMGNDMQLTTHHLSISQIVCNLQWKWNTTLLQPNSLNLQATKSTILF